MALQRIACWLVLNLLESEMKQFAFLIAQDLANIYRKHSMAELLAMFTHDGGGGHATSRPPELVDVLRGSKEHLPSFKEVLHLEVADGPRRLRGVRETLESAKEAHDVRIKDRQMLAWVMDKLERISQRTSQNALAQEQEQEQEQEKEQMTVHKPERQKVIYSDLAFSRVGEEQVPWPIELLCNSSDPSAASAFYPASEFACEHGRTINLPGELLLSNNWYRKAWHGPRRIKNAILILEWIPSLRALSEQREGSRLSQATLSSAQRVIAQLWRIFAVGGHLAPDALHALLVTARLVLPTDVLADEHRVCHGLSSQEELEKLLLGPRFRTAVGGRRFLVVSLGEAASLRVAIHARRSEPLMRTSGGESAGDSAIGLRAVAQVQLSPPPRPANES